VRPHILFFAYYADFHLYSLGSRCLVFEIFVGVPCLGRGRHKFFDEVLFLCSYLRSPFQPDFFCHADVEKGGFSMDPCHYRTLRSSAYPCAIHRYYRSPVLCRPYLVALRDYFFRSHCPRKQLSVTRCFVGQPKWRSVGAALLRHVLPQPTEELLLNLQVMASP
jgi:hypothetical protein